MSRRAVASMFVVATAVLLVGAVGTSPAVAGGGCHGGATQGRGDTVNLVKACFHPSVIRADVGTNVTFVNRDPIAHNVSANGWGFYGDLQPGDTYVARFDEPGIYPFACTYHPGMTGAVVVGDGTGPGSGEAVTQDLQGASADGTAAESTAQTGTGLGWLVGGAVGLALGAALVLVVRRRRPTA